MAQSQYPKNYTTSFTLEKVRHERLMRMVTHSRLSISEFLRGLVDAEWDNFSKEHNLH